MTVSATIALGQRIAAAREHAGMTQAALAAALGVRANTVARWEQGRQEPATAYLEAIARVTGTTLVIEFR